MPGVMRWRAGSPTETYRAIAAETVIEIGDMVFTDAHGTKPASEAAGLEEFAAGFDGVAMQRSPAGQAGDIRIDSGAIFEFECDDDEELSAYSMVGPAVVDGRLQNQRVARVESWRMAIGLVVNRRPAAGSVVVDVCSTRDRRSNDANIASEC